ncbi:MAG: M43 family zinc metalloprotease [Bacteroidia bacterium]
MKQVNSLLALCFLLIPVLTFAQPQRSCNTMDYLEIQLQENPGMEVQMTRIEQFTQNYINNLNDNQRAVITIPTVVHVVYRTSSQNVSTAQIQSQIDVLNADFRTKSTSWPVGADAEIEFCLASVDPNGNPTSGITRTATNKRSFSYSNDGVKFNSMGGHDAWPASDYLNLWVCDLGSGLLGYAQFPGGNPATDGVVIDYAYFGTIGTATQPFHLGRTATHEVGHWLNLRHIWGDGGCSVDDFVSDTPVSDAPNYGCPNGHISCSTLDMIENYMDYTDDACMDIFTAGQKARMQAALAGPRSSLATSNGCGTASGPTCSDGIQNGNETGIDCGGSCDPCSGGNTCDAPVVSASAGKKKITLSWGTATGANSYTAYLGPVGGPYSSKTTTGTSTSFTGLSSGATYEYYVESDCGSNGTASSPLQTASPNRILPGTDPVTVYPVPAQDYLVVEFGAVENDEVDVILMDIVGKVVYTNRNVNTNGDYLEINLNKLDSGVYFLKVQDGADQSYMQKIVITK